MESLDPPHAPKHTHASYLCLMFTQLVLSQPLTLLGLGGFKKLFPTSDGGELITKFSTRPFLQLASQN